MTKNHQSLERLAYHSSLVYENFIPYMEFIKDEYILIMEALKKRLADNGLHFKDGPSQANHERKPLPAPTDPSHTLSPPHSRTL